MDELNPMENLNIANCEDGGVLREIFKAPDFGQLTLRSLLPGAKTEKHRHFQADEWWVVCQGEAIIETQDTDLSPVIRTVTSGKWPQVVKISAGAWHTMENVGSRVALLLFHSTKIYDPKEPDRHT